MKKLNVLFFAMLLSVFLMEKSAMAGDILGINFGALVGYSSLNASNEFGDGNGVFGFGTRAGIEFLSSFAANAEWTYTSTTPTGTTTGFTSSFSILSASVDYVFSLIPRLAIFVGPKVGYGSTNSGGSSGTSMGFGGEAGADFFTRSERWSFGGEVSFLSVAAPTINNTTGSSGSLIQVLATAKFWL